MIIRLLTLTLLLVSCDSKNEPSGERPTGDTDTDTDTDTDADADADADTDTDTTAWPKEPENCGVWAEGTQADDDGATRDYYNRAVSLTWRNELGDWADASGVEQGTNAYAVTGVTDDNTPAWQSWDVTSLVQEWLDGSSPNKGFFLTSPPGPFIFASKESPNPGERPELVIETAAGNDVLSPAADTYVDSSTYQGFGDGETLRVGTGSNTLIRFDLNAFMGDTLTNATLRLYKLEDYGGGTTDVSVFRSSHGNERTPTAPLMGLAQDYPEDAGIETHDSVLLFSNFQNANWGDDWTSGSVDDHLEIVDATEGNSFVTYAGNALRVEVSSGDNYGASLVYKFMDETGAEPEEAYFRYYLRFGENWLPTDGGKLPGISGTYGVAGWGGRPVDGTDGWSARGTYAMVVPDGNPLERHSSIGNYVYHADMAGQYGDVDFWLDGCAGALDKNRWYSVETYVQLNTPGNNDGILRGWVDGRLAYERLDWRWRDVDTLKVEQIWMNIYHGGGGVPPTDLHLYIDNVVIASEYIGPRADP